MDYPYKTHNKAVEVLQKVGFVTFIVSSIICAVIMVIALLVMSAEQGEISEQSKYTNYDYQEYLIKNPGYKLKANNQVLTKYERPDLPATLTIELDMGSGNVYEAFAEKKDWSPIKAGELYVSTSKKSIVFAVRKSESDIKELIAEDVKSMAIAKYVAWVMFKGAFIFGIMIILFTKIVFYWAWEDAYPYIKKKIDGTLEKHAKNKYKTKDSNDKK